MIRPVSRRDQLARLSTVSPNARAETDAARQEARATRVGTGFRRVPGRWRLSAQTCRHEWRHGTSGDVRHEKPRDVLPTAVDVRTPRPATPTPLSMRAVVAHGPSILATLSRCEDRGRLRGSAKQVGGRGAEQQDDDRLDPVGPGGADKNCV